ncbi:MAG: hypothetical protein HKN25_07705 [Pyrinomonadaceae bacterium]|nr:hypothetical protein [Pyrinomonadaceae bacterium]
MKKQTVVHTPTKDLGESIDFYKRLEFEMLSEKDPTVFTDGKALVEINPIRHARAGIKMYAEDWSENLPSPDEVGKILETDDGYLLCDPNGVRVYLANGAFEVDYQAKPESFGLTGNYAGLSIEAHDIDKTAKFWAALGFVHKDGDLAQGWASYSNGSGMDISLMKPLMCPHLFFNPGLTYFNSGKNLTNIGKLREAGIEFAEEITQFNTDGVADNVIIRDPGGYGFFIFND